MFFVFSANFEFDWAKENRLIKQAIEKVMNRI